MIVWTEFSSCLGMVERLRNARSSALVELPSSGMSAKARACRQRRGWGYRALPARSPVPIATNRQNGAGGNQGRAGQPFKRICHPGMNVLGIVGKLVDQLITAAAMAEVARLPQRLRVETAARP
jgi:hypothetical protein